MAAASNKENTALAWLKRLWPLLLLLAGMLVSNEGGATFRVIIPDVVVELQRARRRSA